MTKTPVPTLTVQPIHFTSEYVTWKQFYLQLGLRETEADDPMTTILAADSGQLMLGEVPEDSHLNGIRLVEFTVDDLDVYASALEAAGTEVNRVELTHDRNTIAVDLPQGRVHIGESAVSAGTARFDPTGLSIGALLYTPAETVTIGAHALAPYGLTPRIASNNGGWTDLIGHGVFAFHEGTLRTVDNDAPYQPVISLFAETGDVEKYMAELQPRGVEVSLIDEAYGRTLNITQPDGGILTVNESQQDLYGYHRLDP
ncbi:VOC family protein [Nesterenkonia muleiensis]|uniref:VOC family protein n=1 Tax=Nesterenkonia muleiensis TaxID=2282648 RepID=UPI000E716975|nr:hypothetical protein [Nesterenkonia muleiensis]